MKGRGAGDLRLTLVLAAIMALGPLAIDMYLPALPALQAEFSSTPAAAQRSVSAYLFGMALGQLAFGPLTDRFGRKPPLLAGLVLFGVASAGCALAGSITSFVFIRFFQALGGASGQVVIRAVVRDRFDPTQGARVLSLMLLVMGVAPILAPLLGGWLLVAASWHWIFWLLVVYSVAAILVAWRFLDESHPRHARTASLKSAASAMGPLLANRRFLGPMLVFMSAFGGFFAYLAGAPFAFIQYFGVPADRFGLYFGANALGYITVSQLNRRLVLGRGPRKVLGWGVVILACAALLLWLASVTGLGGFPAVFVLLFCMMGSLGLIASNATAVAMAPFGERAGGAASLLGATQGLTGVLTSAAVGWIDATGAVPMASVIAICGCVCLASYLLLVRIRGQSPN